VQLPREINGFKVQGAFLDFYNQMGEKIVGQPISDQVIENGRRTQYFQRMILQQDQSGAIILKDAGVEVRHLRQQLSEARSEREALELEVDELQQKLYLLHSGSDVPLSTDGAETAPAPSIVEAVRPLWEDVVFSLPRHSDKEYERREIGDVKYLVINHSAVPTSVGVEEIARFHVRNMKWPGIGYHFFVDGQGQIYLTNHLTTTCYHVQKWDPVSVGICVSGNFTRVVPSQAQLASTAHLIAWLLQEFGLPLDAIRGKKEFIDTQSPGHQWLTGKKWKDLLLERVQVAQNERCIAHPPQPFYHYLLLWQTATNWARRDWIASREYIGRFRVTHGFAVDDAKVAKYVTIVGNERGVDKKAEQVLLSAGCRVERIAGRDSTENGQILSAMAQRGQRFLSYAG
jgi:hypothetical protein